MLAFELLQVAVGVRTELSRIPSDKEWDAIYQFSDKHTIVGFMWGGVEKLPRTQTPYTDLLMEWLGQAEYIRNHNTCANTACWKAVDYFENLGCQTTIIKGLAVGRYYPLPELRTSGDIDVWCVKRGMSLESSRRYMAHYALEKNKNACVQPHHVDYDEQDGICVELHFTPSIVSNPIYNKRVQRYFTETLSRCDNHSLPVDADAMFQLMHIRRHLIGEGIGLRQVVDLYFTLKRLKAEGLRINDYNLRRFGLYSFACAMNWMLYEVFADSDISSTLTTAKDGRRGRFILAEIMNGGNFGRHDVRYAPLGTNRWQHLWYYTRLALRCVKYFPDEALWSPFYRIYVGLWRKQFKQQL